MVKQVGEDFAWGLHCRLYGTVMGRLGIPCFMLSSIGILGAYRVASGQFEYLRNHQELSNAQRMKDFPLIEN